MKQLLRSFYRYILWVVIPIIPSNTLRKILLGLCGAKFAKNVSLYHGFEIREPNQLVIGENSIIGFDCILDARRGLEIGSNVNIGSEVMIWSLQHDYNSSSFETSGGKVIIEDYAWVSARVIILPGITIGRGAVVAAGAVVTKNVEPYTMVGGIPAKFIGKRTMDLTYKLGNKRLHFL